MAQGIIAYDTAWGIATEPDFGTPVVPTAFIPFQSETLTKEYEVLELTTTQTRQQQEFIGATDKHLGRVKVAGDVKFNVEPINFGYVLKHAIGQDAVTDADGAGAETITDHLFKVDNVLKPFTSQVRLADGKAKRVQGGMIDQLSIDFAEDMLTASAGVKAQDLVIIDAPAAPVYPTQRPYVYTDAMFSLGGTDVTGQITNGSIQLSNNVIDDDYRQGTSLLQGLYAGTLQVEGTFEVVYDPALAAGTFYDWVEDKKKQDLIARYRGNAVGAASYYDLTVKIPRSIVTGSSPQVSAGEKVKRTVAFRAFYDVTSPDPDKGINVVLRNEKTTPY